ncbi:MAG: hypothetical protein ACFFCU_10825 [Promethearchaeota archaeon]
MKRILLLSLLITSILFSSVSVISSSRLSTLDDEPDFMLVEDLDPWEIQPGLHYIGTRIKNNGSAAAVSGNVSITWENLYYELVLDNGTGMLNETIMDHDLNGDGAKTTIYNVTWLHNANRPWDAVINGSAEDIRAYSLWEGPIDNPWSNQTFDINGMSKLFQLGNQKHVLYGADNNTARFGFGAVIKTHSCPHLELEITSSISVVDMRIDNNLVEKNYSGTREVYSEGNWSTTTRYIISSPAFELDAGKNVSLSFILVASEATTAYLGLFMNWSPDGNARKNWKLIEIPVPTQALDLPFLWTLDYSYTEGKTGELNFNGTFINYGLPIPAGTVQSSQEDLLYLMDLPLGAGALNESELGMDLNGDGDQTDIFNVKWAGSSTRKYDANIIDGTAEIHVYAILEMDYPSWWIRNHTVNGQSKVFQLGSENHLLYWADSVEEKAYFGLGNAVVPNHPSPFFHICVFSAGVDSLDHLTVEDFKINGKIAELNWTGSTIDKWILSAPNTIKNYIVYSPGLEITTGEKVTFSYTIKATSNANFGADFYLNWSPDGIQRYTWPYFRGNDPDLDITWPCPSTRDDTSTTTTTTTATTSTPPPGVPGFTFLAPAVLVVPIVLTSRRRKRD